MQVGAGRERAAVRRIGIPDHDALEALLGFGQRALDALDDAVADHVHLRLQRDDEHLVARVPQAHGIVFEHGGAGGLRILAARAHDRCAELLALIDRQVGPCYERVLRDGVRTFRRVHALLRDRGAEHPCRQRCVGQGLARLDVFLDPLSDGVPAGGLPRLERADAPAEAPAHREVDVARVVRDRIQVEGDVVESVAEDRPQELRLRVGRFAHRLEFLDRVLFFQDARDDVGRLGAARHVFARRGVQAQDVLADFLVEAGARLLAQRALLDQLRQHVRRLVHAEERVVLQVVLHRLDDVAHRVQADDVRRAERTRLGAAQLGAGQVVDDVHGQAELLGFVDRGQHAEDADAVGDEVRRVFRAHDALAQRGRQERLELVEDCRLRGRGRDQFDQVHVARRVEEVHAAEARLQVGVEAFGQLLDRQARRVRREDRVGADVRGDLLVQVVLPVHALGDGFDDQVAAGQHVEVVLVVGDFDQRGVFLVAQRRRRQLFQVLDGFQNDAVFRTAGALLRLGRQVEQHDRNLGVDAVRSDLRAHHAGAQHGDFLDDEISHLS